MQVGPAVVIVEVEVAQPVARHRNGLGRVLLRNQRVADVEQQVQVVVPQFRDIVEGVPHRGQGLPRKMLDAQPDAVPGRRVGEAGHGLPVPAQRRPVPFFPRQQVGPSDTGLVGVFEGLPGMFDGHATSLGVDRVEGGAFGHAESRRHARGREFQVRDHAAGFGGPKIEGTMIDMAQARLCDPRQHVRFRPRQGPGAAGNRHEPDPPCSYFS